MNSLKEIIIDHLFCASIPIVPVPCTYILNICTQYIPDLSCGSSFRLVLVSIIMPFFEHICHKDILASSTTFSALVQESDISSRILHSFSNASNKDNKGSPESQGRYLGKKIEQDKVKQTIKQMDNGYLAETGCITGDKHLKNIQHAIMHIFREEKLLHPLKKYRMP